MANQQIIGYNVQDLAKAIEASEPHMKTGKTIEVTVCTDTLPSTETLAQFVLDADNAGFATSFPATSFINGVPTTSFVMGYKPNIRGMTGASVTGQWQLLIPIILPVFFGGLAIYAVTQLKNIVDDLMPIIIVGGALVLSLVIILAKPAERVATQYIQSGRQLPPGPKLLTSTKDRGRVDYMSRSGKWRVIAYKGSKDVPIGDYATKPVAEQALRDYVSKRNYMPAVIPNSSATPDRFKGAVALFRSTRHPDQYIAIMPNPPGSGGGYYILQSPNSPRYPEYMRAAYDPRAVRYDLNMGWLTLLSGQLPSELQDVKKGKFIIKKVNDDLAVVSRNDSALKMDVGSGRLARETMKKNPKDYDLSKIPEGHLEESNLYEALHYELNLTPSEAKQVVSGKELEIRDNDPHSADIWASWYRTFPPFHAATWRPCNYTADSELISNVHAAWNKCAEWEKIHHPGKVIDSKDFTFAEDNPYLDDYGIAIGKVMRMQELERRGGWQADTNELIWDYWEEEDQNPVTKVRYTRKTWYASKKSGGRNFVARINFGHSNMGNPKLIGKYIPEIEVHEPNHDFYADLPLAYDSLDQAKNAVVNKIAEIEKQGMHGIGNYLLPQTNDPFSMQKIEAEYDALKSGKPPIDKAIVRAIGYAEAGLKQVATSTYIKFNRQNVIEWTYDLLHPEKFSSMTVWEPLNKFCCRICGDCAPADLLEEGKFPDRMAWLRRHYEEKHPGMWGTMSAATIPLDEVIKDLQKSMDEEWKAAEVYRERARKVENTLPLTADLWKHIAGEEEGNPDSHYVEFDRELELIKERLGVGYSASTQEMILNFSDYKEGMLRWVGRFPDKTWIVVVKGFQPAPEEAMKAAFRYSKATINNIVTNHDLLFAGAEDYSLWFQTSIGNLPVVVEISDIQHLKELRLTDIFNEAVAVIQEQIIPVRRPMTELREFMAKTKTSTPDYIREVIEGNLFTEDEVQQFTGMKGQNPLGIKDEEWRQFMRANGGDFVKTGEFYQFVTKTPYTPPGIKPSREDLVGPNPAYPDYVPGRQEYISDSAEYMADTIVKTGWREKIDEAFQSAVERLHKS